MGCVGTNYIMTPDSVEMTTTTSVVPPVALTRKESATEQPQTIIMDIWPAQEYRHVELRFSFLPVPEERHELVWIWLHAICIKHGVHLGAITPHRQAIATMKFDHYNSITIDIQKDLRFHLRLNDHLI